MARYGISFPGYSAPWFVGTSEGLELVGFPSLMVFL